MLDRRLAKIAKILDETDRNLSELQRFCVAGVTILNVDGVSLCLVLNNVINSQSSSESHFALLDEEQFALGDGPSFDAAHSLSPISAIDFLDHQTMKRWPVFHPVAQANGIHSMVAFPLHIGESHFGVLTAYRKNKEAFSNSFYAAGVSLSMLVSSFVVVHLTGKTVADVQEALEVVSQDQSVIHFAAGMVAEKLNIPVIDALVRIRAYAFRENIPLGLVATRISEHQIEINELD